MTSVNTLRRYVCQVAPTLSEARLDLLTRLVRGLLLTRSVNLMKVAVAMGGPTQVMSRYRRLQRFFSSGLSASTWLPWLLDRLEAPPIDDPVLLTLDRTHWRLGQREQNLLCLGRVYKGVSIPLDCLALGKAGNSNLSERRTIVRRVMSALVGQRACLLADREFIGGDWIRLLQTTPGLDFILRLRAQGHIGWPNGESAKLEEVMGLLPYGKTWYWTDMRLYDGSRQVTVNLVAHRSKKGTLVLLATNRSDLPQILPLYGQRWSIETAFAFLKSKGFDLEITHLRHPHRLALLIGVLALCLLWCLLVGQRQAKTKPIRTKKHGRPARSLVRTGLDALQNVLLNAHQHRRELRQYCQILLSCT